MKKSPWRKLADESPGLCIDVLLWDGKRRHIGWNESDKGENVSFVQYYRKENGTYGACGVENVTHWMYLPEPPHV